MCKQSVKRWISIWAMILIILALVFAWRVVCGSLLPILPPRRPIAINSRPATDFFLTYNSFLPLLPGCCFYVIVFLCTHFCCWGWCTDLCVSFIANPPPGAQLRLTVDLPLIVSRYQTSDIPFAAKPRNIFCYLDKYIDNFWQWFGKM